MKRLKIGFIWYGFTGKYGQWKDGLWAAMKRIEADHDVTYLEPADNLNGYDVLLFWESPMTRFSFPWYDEVRLHPTRKALLYAGGQIQKESLDGFDHVFVESKINDLELDAMGVPHSVAFGVNELNFKPIDVPKAYDGFMQATFAGWKRQPLFAEALGSKGVLCGRYQENDRDPWDHSSQSIRLPEMPYPAVNALLNSAHVAVNTAEFWGGGQRCTLEALSAGVPVVVMSDSPKNREYVEESGAGLVVNPDPESIRKAVEEIKGWPEEKKTSGRAYVHSKWTSKHYADNLLKFIEA